jgi:hypothetical protein
VQTFLPYPDFAASAACLDWKRLGKQRVEVLQILNVLQNPEARGWRNHPATLMWRGYEVALIRYGVAVCDEWTKRGYRDTVRQKLLDRLPDGAHENNPPWLGDDRLHASHRSKLLGKDPEHYGQFGWTDPPGMEAFWPSGSPELLQAGGERPR